MHASSTSGDLPSALVALAALVLIISRLLRWARLNTGDVAEPRQQPPTRRPLWGPVRRLERLQQDNAIVRSEIELLVSAGEHLQARHNLDRLKAELSPVQALRLRGAANTPALTIPEIRAVIDTFELTPELRVTILELLEATANEKGRQ